MNTLQAQNQDSEFSPQSWIAQSEKAKREHSAEPSQPPLSFDDSLALLRNEPGAEEVIEKASAENYEFAVLDRQNHWVEKPAFAHFHGAILESGHWYLLGHVDHNPLPTVLKNPGAFVAVGFTGRSFTVALESSREPRPAMRAFLHHGSWKELQLPSPGGPAPYTFSVNFNTDTSSRPRFVYFAVTEGKVYVNQIRVTHYYY